MRYKSAGKNLSKLISRICTNAAITPIKVRKLRKLKSASGKPAHAKCAWSKNVYINNWLTGTEIPSTTITATPRPIAVLLLRYRKEGTHT